MTVKASLSPYIISSQELNQFVQITGDNNSIHLDAKAAAKRFTTVNSPVVHGVMILGKVSAYVTKVFGDGTVIRKIEDLVFRQPLQVGQSFVITHQVLCTHGQTTKVSFRVLQDNSKTEEFVSGRAIILLP